MSFEITKTFVQEYKDNVLFLSQQRGSRLRNAVYVDSGVVGTFLFQDQVGVATYNTVINRNGDTPVNNTPFTRRRIQLVARDVGDLIDKIDKVQMLIDPTSATAQTFMYSMGRAIDDTIIASFFGTAYTNSGIDGTTPTAVTFPSGNIIAVNDRTFQDQGNTATGNSSLTVSKILSGRNLFMGANVDMDNDECYCAPSSQQINALLTATPVTSIWYNAVKPLVDGNVSQFVGVNFIRTELTIKNGLGVSLLSSSNALVPMWMKSGVCLGIGEDVEGFVQPRYDKRGSYQVYFQMFMGAARLEEAKVAQLICDPTKTN